MTISLSHPGTAHRICQLSVKIKIMPIADTVRTETDFSHITAGLMPAVDHKTAIRKLCKHRFIGIHKIRTVPYDFTALPVFTAIITVQSCNHRRMMASDIAAVCRNPNRNDQSAAGSHKTMTRPGCDYCPVILLSKFGICL